MTEATPHARARSLRQAAGADVHDVDTDAVVELLRYPERAVQRDAAAALLAVLTEFPAADTHVVDRLAHLLATLEDAAPPGECDAERVEFGETLLLCLARVATHDPERVLAVREAILDRLRPPDGPLVPAASVCVLQLLETDPAAFVPHVTDLAALLAVDDASTRRHAAHAFTVLADAHPDAVAPVSDALAVGLAAADPETVQKTTSALGLLARDDADAVVAHLPNVVARLDHSSDAVRANAAGAVADVAGGRPGVIDRHVGNLVDRFDDDAPLVRRNATATFARVAAQSGSVPSPADGALIELLDDTDPTVRALACRALGHVGAPAAVELLRTTSAEDPDRQVREAARWALEQITT